MLKTLNKSGVSVAPGVFAFESSTSRGRFVPVCCDLVIDCKKCSTNGENWNIDALRPTEIRVK